MADLDLDAIEARRRQAAYMAEHIWPPDAGTVKALEISSADVDPLVAEVRWLRAEVRGLRAAKHALSLALDAIHDDGDDGQQQ